MDKETEKRYNILLNELKKLNDEDEKKSDEDKKKENLLKKRHVVDELDKIKRQFKL